VYVHCEDIPTERASEELNSGIRVREWKLEFGCVSVFWVGAGDNVMETFEEDDDLVLSSCCFRVKGEPPV